jgi:glycosyltransferase involved in cell wall biosynthesis
MNSSITLFDVSSALELLRLAILFEEKGEFEKAAAHYEAYIVARPGFGNLYDYSINRCRANFEQCSGFRPRHAASCSSNRRNVTLDVSGLTKWLWSGFSSHSESLLKERSMDSRVDTRQRVDALINLARWSSFNKCHADTIETIKRLRNLDIKQSRSKRMKLLLIEAYIDSGNLALAKEVLDYAVVNTEDNDYLCALNNYLIAAKSKPSTREDVFGTIFSRHGLEPVTFNSSIQYREISCRSVSTTIDQGPLVSVLIAAYNAEELIELSLNSIRNQSYRNLEIIVVDDCSPDQTWRKINRIAEDDIRIRPFRNEINRGAYPTRNFALAQATGDYITVHDSDDWSHPQMIDIQLSHMLNQKSIKATFSMMARVYPDLSFMLRPQRNNLEYIHRSYPSQLVERDTINLLGRWDDISANADDELVQRMRALWGKKSIMDVMPNVPLSFFLVHSGSLTQQAGTSLNSLTFGIRKEYSRQASFWRDQMVTTSQPLRLERESLKKPFPIPPGLAPKDWKRNNYYDLLLISDLSLLGGTRRCNEAYISIMQKIGLRVGMFHWPRFDLHPADISDTYTKLSYNDNVDFIVPEDDIEVETVIIHHPPILAYDLDRLPVVRMNNLYILVNQCPMQLQEETNLYYLPSDVESLCIRRFGKKPKWISISPVVSNVLAKFSPKLDMIADIWYPPYSNSLPSECPLPPTGLGSSRNIIVGRHSRDHWTKWPENSNDLLQAYCANVNDITVKLLGGAREALKKIKDAPTNWSMLDFDSVSTLAFVESLDFFIHFTHSEYIEEFGRNIMEAMASGRVVILPGSFRTTFADAAVYCRVDQVETRARFFWSNPPAYRNQALKGFNFVKEHCSIPVVKGRIKKALLTCPGDLRTNSLELIQD